MFTVDLNNNVGRYAALKDGSNQGRIWRVQTAVTGHRYLVRNIHTGECRVVNSRTDISQLY